MTYAAIPQGIDTQNINTQNIDVANPGTVKAPDLDSELQAALEHARRLTSMYGTSRPEVAVAWDVVEEMMAEKARQRAKKKTAFAEYCEHYPDALESRLYDV